MQTSSQMKMEDIPKQGKKLTQEERYSKLRLINVNITEFQLSQVQALCKIGIAKNPTDFTRQAVLDFIRQNKYLLPAKFLPPRERGARKRQKLK